ncbi:hypothetical protein QJ043_04355 [Olsenella sp. YH-ols2217]|uniref:PTS EIIB type-3 domain-containing protein n=1 Tax=Kribbibacterium absianum TaxID=3044210 RepID=A0ABT6ZKX4_9ACTN|nr:MULTISPECIES: hypothetical protein [unclassified Olsenella]MDJ1122435.1 hypothetical protein [Olsenella sp. YH-ols2216]MDJ1129311.1 hypothetical protein [Olsenella sp. YH-ols2217]
MKVLFVCSGGMSSTIAEQALQKECAKHGQKIEVTACGTGQVRDAIAKQGPDCIMVAPQVRHRFKEMSEEAGKADIPIVLIEPQAYSPLGGAKLYQQYADLMGL